MGFSNLEDTDTSETTSETVASESVIENDTNHQEETVDEMMLCSFRIDNLSANDLEQIAAFKRIVKNYLKMNYLEQKQ